MADNSIRRIAIAAPITAIAFDSKHHILYAGSGGQLLCYRNIGEQNDGKEMAEVGPNDIFSAHTIHGIKCVDSVIPKVISFGGKGVCVASIQEDQTQLHARSIDEFMVELLLEDLDDLVLDCFLTDTMLFIGFAHNFIDVMVIIRAQLAPTFIYRVQCPDISALFSLTIAVSDPDFNSEDHRRMLVASGTAFGKIILWDFSLPIIATAESILSQENVIPTITINNTLINHEGESFFPL